MRFLTELDTECFARYDGRGGEQVAHYEQRQREWDDDLAAYCRLAGLTTYQTLATELAYVDEMDIPAIALKLHHGQRQVRLDLDAASEKLERFMSTCNSLSRQFARNLLECIRNKSVSDERPPDVRGVEESRIPVRYPAAVLMNADDVRLQQDGVAVRRLFEQQMGVEQTRVLALT